jgi:Na+-transporting NADH:ubiquinone oxidoreductase subunit A
LARIIKIRNGLDIPIPGSPEQSIHPGPDVKHVALCGPDYVGLRARLLVAKGEPVGLGQPLFIDKNDPAVPHCSPGTGHVVAINRGARRALESVVVRLADRATAKKLFEPLASEEIHALDAQAVAGRVQQSGLWTAFRTRPFSRVPFSDSRPSSIFVTAMDTRPLSADPVVVIEGEANAFMTGLQLMGKLTGGSVYLCTAAQSGIEAPGIDRLRHAEFHGPHPAGLPGTHIHHLEPAGARRVAWHIGYQDVIAIGKLFSTGVLDTGRIIALGGEGIFGSGGPDRPGHVRFPGPLSPAGVCHPRRRGQAHFWLDRLVSPPLHSRLHPVEKNQAQADACLHNRSERAVQRDDSHAGL